MRKFAGVAFVASIVGVLLLGASLAFLLPARANDDGGKGGSKGGSAGATATAVASSAASAKGGAGGEGGSATASSGGGNVSQDNKTYAVGGTGLTSTAPCLSSVSVLFGLIATTYVEKSCVHRLYAANCKDDACRQKMACLDPDLSDAAKVALGCK